MPLCVLIVEDDPATRAAVALLLQMAGYATAEVADGAQAVAFLRANPAPRLVLLDMMMPVMDGWQFLDARRHDPALASAPVVLFTAAGNLGPAAARALGADDLLPKPADPTRILDLVGRYC